MVTMEKASLFTAAWPRCIRAQLIGFGIMSTVLEGHFNYVFFFPIFGIGILSWLTFFSAEKPQATRLPCLFGHFVWVCEWLIAEILLFSNWNVYRSLVPLPPETCNAPSLYSASLQIQAFGIPSAPQASSPPWVWACRVWPCWNQTCPCRPWHILEVPWPFSMVPGVIWARHRSSTCLRCPRRNGGMGDLTAKE